jgi:hypothetical protein
MRAGQEFTEQILASATEALARDPVFAGKLTQDIEQMAAGRRWFRTRFYWLAAGQLIVSAFNAWMAFVVEPVWLHWLNIAGFSLAFVGMFRAEFSARTLTRQLKRPAAEQMARDMIGVEG